MRDPPTVNKEKHVRVKLRTYEYDAMMAGIDKNPARYPNKSIFIRDAIEEKLLTMGIEIIIQERPRVVRHDISFRITQITEYLKKNVNEWICTTDVMNHFKIDNSQINRILTRMEDNKLISSKYGRKGKSTIKLWKWIKRRPLTGKQLDVVYTLRDNNNWLPATNFGRNTVLSLIKRGIVERDGDFIRLNYAIEV